MLKEIAEELRKKLRETVEESPAEGLLFSGGLDSGILAYLSPGIKAITITLDSFGKDLPYAKRLATKLKVAHYPRSITVEEAIGTVPQVIRILKSFDPAIPNDITVYLGLQYAKKMGIQTIMTGDGGDELFAGYSYMHTIPDLDEYIKRVSSSLFFSSSTLAESAEIRVQQPYLSKEFVDFSLTIPVDLKVKRVNGDLVGKWILRKAFEDVLPQDIIWQDKRPLEYGSGMTKLREIIAARVKDDEFNHAKDVYSVRFINKEHYYYYKMYRREVGEIPPPLPGETTCPGCGTGLQKGGRHCKVCGWTKKL